MSWEPAMTQNSCRADSFSIEFAGARVHRARSVRTLICACNYRPKSHAADPPGCFVCFIRLCVSCCVTSTAGWTKMPSDEIRAARKRGEEEAE